MLSALEFVLMHCCVEWFPWIVPGVSLKFSAIFSGRSRCHYICVFSSVDSPCPFFIDFKAVLLAVALNVCLFVGSHLLFVGTHGSNSLATFGTKYMSFRQKSFAFRRAICSLDLLTFSLQRAYFHYFC